MLQINALFICFFSLQDVTDHQHLKFMRMKLIAVHL